MNTMDAMLITCQEQRSPDGYAWVLSHSRVLIDDKYRKHWFVFIRLRIFLVDC